MATTVTTPWYFLGIVPWGTTTATVPLMSSAAAVGVGVGAFFGGLGVAFGASYGITKYVAHRNTCLANSVPIAVCNCSGDQIVVHIKNLESSSNYYPAIVDDIVHDARAYCGVGQRKLTL